MTDISKDDVPKGPDAPTTETAGPKGIGGWLILPMLGTIFAPVLTLFGAYTSATALNGSLSAGLSAVIVIEVLFNLGLAVG